MVQIVSGVIILRKSCGDYIFPQKQQLSLNDFLWHSCSLAFTKIAQRATHLISPTTPLLQDCCDFSPHSFHGLEKFLPFEILAEMSASTIQSSTPWGILQLRTSCSSYMTCTEHGDLCHGHTLTQPPPLSASARTYLIDGPFPWVNEYVCSRNTQRLLMSYDCTRKKSRRQFQFRHTSASRVCFAFQLPSPKGVRQRANFLQRKVFTLKLSYDDVKLEDR